MYLVQMFLPLSDQVRQRFPRNFYETVEGELTRAFQGFTAYPRAPASGLWKNPSNDVERDELVIYEVMVETLDRNWWNGYRAALERQFRQDQILIRASDIEVL